MVEDHNSTPYNCYKNKLLGCNITCHKRFGCRSEKYNVKCHKKLKSKPSLELINFEMKWHSSQFDITKIHKEGSNKLTGSGSSYRQWVSLNYVRHTKETVLQQWIPSTVHKETKISRLPSRTQKSLTLYLGFQKEDQNHVKCLENFH